MYEMDSKRERAFNLSQAMYVKVEKLNENDYAVFVVYPSCFGGASREYPIEYLLSHFTTIEEAKAYLEDIVANY